MIELKLIEKKYPDSNKVLFIENLQLRPGEVTAVLGANGSGKTSLLKMIMGLGENTIPFGSVTVDDRPVQEQYDKLSFITHEGSYFPYMTPREYGKFLADFYARFNMARYEQLLQFFELNLDTRIASMSTGQKSKLEICAGFSKGAKYVLMDEPFNGKDMFTRRDFLKLMVSSLQEDEAIIVTSHMVDELENVIDRAIILHNGRIRADVMLDELRDAGGSLTELMAEKAGYDSNSFKLTQF